MSHTDAIRRRWKTSRRETITSGDPDRSRGGTLPRLPARPAARHEHPRRAAHGLHESSQHRHAAAESGRPPALQSTFTFGGTGCIRTACFDAAATTSASYRSSASVIARIVADSTWLPMATAPGDGPSHEHDISGSAARVTADVTRPSGSILRSSVRRTTARTLPRSSSHQRRSGSVRALAHAVRNCRDARADQRVGSSRIQLLPIHRQLRGARTQPSPCSFWGRRPSESLIESQGACPAHSARPGTQRSHSIAVVNHRPECDSSPTLPRVFTR